MNMYRYTSAIKRQLYIGLAFLILSCSNEATQHAYTTLPYTELEQMNIRLPYINYYGMDSSLLVYGSNHTANYQDPQIVDIESRISAFKPTIILYEGDGIATEANKEATVNTYFEMGLVKYLADSLHISALNIEPNTVDKYQHLLTSFSTDEIILATLGLQITMMQIEDDGFESHYPLMIKDLKEEGLPLTDSQMTTSYFYNIYQGYFKTNFSYQSFDSRDIQAKYNRTSLNKVNQYANEFRDQHVLSLVDSLLSINEKVYLQIGGWHAIVCQPGFREIADK